MYVCMCMCVYLKYADVWDIRWVEIWNKDGSIVIIQKSYRRSRNSLLAPAIFSHRIYKKSVYVILRENV